MEYKIGSIFKVRGGVNVYEGIFVRELKNRFLCVVLIDKEEITCYVPASCRLSNFGNFAGCKVLLTENHGKKSRTRFSLYAIYCNRKCIIVNLKEANRIIESNIQRRLFAFLGKRKNIRREYWINDYKCDLFIEDSKTVIEIKSVLLFGCDNKVLQIHSERAVKQLQSINKLLNEGYKVCYFYVSTNPTVTNLIVEEQNSEFHWWFKRNMELGMICKAYTIGLKQRKTILKKEIDIKYKDQAQGDQL